MIVKLGDQQPNGISGAQVVERLKTGPGSLAKFVSPKRCVAPRVRNRMSTRKGNAIDRIAML